MSSAPRNLEEALARIAQLESRVAGTNAALTAVALLLRQMPEFNPGTARHVLEVVQRRSRPPGADPEPFREALDVFRFYILGTGMPAEVVQMPMPRPAAPDQSPDATDD